MEFEPPLEASACCSAGVANLAGSEVEKALNEEVEARRELLRIDEVAVSILLLLLLMCVVRVGWGEERDRNEEFFY